MKYKKGDIVKIKEHMSQKDYFPVGWNFEMEKYLGKVVTIVNVTVTSTATYYRIKEDNGRWSWVSSMFVSVTKEMLRNW